MNHSQVSLLYVCGTSVLGISWILGGFPCLSTCLIIEFLIACYLDQQVAIPFSVGSKS